MSASHEPSSALSRLVERLAVPRERIGAQAFRWVIGATLLYQFLICYAQRGYLFGPDGIYPYELFEQSLMGLKFSLLTLSRSQYFFEVVYHGTLAAVVAWTLGVRTRIMTPLVYIGVQSLQNRFPGIWDGGDNLITVLLVYAMFMDLAPRRVAEAVPSLRTKVRNLVHSGALLACVLQVCILYFVAGAAKLDGKYWQNGTAFYYVLASGEFGVSDWGPAIWNNPVLLSLATWGPIVLQISLPPLVLFGRPWARRIVVLAAIGFHLGIVYFMGLVTFGVFMIGTELLLLHDEDYRAFADIARRGQRWGAAAWRHVRRRVAPTPTSIPRV